MLMRKLLLLNYMFDTKINVFEILTIQSNEGGICRILTNEESKEESEHNSTCMMHIHYVEEYATAF